MEIKHNIYINIDGFAKYYFDEFVKREKNPFLKRIISEGVYFANLKNVLPSITNPCQNMILSGSTSKITNNVYRYYDRNSNIVIQQKRENKTKLISEIAVEKNLRVLSIAHFLTEKDLTSNNVNKLYIKNPGVEKYNYLERFNQLIKVIKKEEVVVEGASYTIEEFPNLVILYVDDLDGLGHNFQSTYGSNLALNEEQRIDNVINTLKLIDAKIEETVKALKEMKLYNNTRIFITTDHGMTPYGSYYNNVNDKYTFSKIPDLIKKLKMFNKDFEIEFLSPGEKAKDNTNVVIVGANLNVQLIFLDDLDNQDLKKLKKHLLEEYYVYNVKTREELAAEGFWTFASDLTISPAERYHFSKDINKAAHVKAQHDSMQPSSNNVVGWIFGGDTLKLKEIETEYYNYDYGVTIAKSLKLVLPNYNGNTLQVFKKKL